MKADEVLNLYKNMMDNFNDWLDMHKFYGDAKTLPALQGVIKETVRVLPDRTVFNYKGPLTLGECGGIIYVGMKASQIANEHTKNIEDFDSYKEEFRKTFSTALRFELYKKFIAKGQQEDNPALIINSVKTFIESGISKFQDIESELTKHWQQEVNCLKTDLLKLLQEFDNKCKNSPSAHPHEIKDAALEFELKAIPMIQKYVIAFENNFSCMPLIKNLLLILTGIGALFTLYSLGHRAVTGHYAFFDQPILVYNFQGNLLINNQHLEEFKKYGFFDGKDSIPSESTKEVELDDRMNIL